MPTILVFMGFRFFFYSNENNEPPHVHIRKGDAEAKFWLNPVSEVHNYGFKSSEIKQIRETVEEQADYFMSKWQQFFQ